MPNVSISGYKYLDADGNGRRASTLIKGSDPDVVLVLDVSGSTISQFFGKAPVGDVNLDGSPNTILDAEIAAAGALHASLMDQGFGGSHLGLDVLCHLLHHAFARVGMRGNGRELRRAREIGRGP